MHFNERFAISALKMNRLGVFNPDVHVDNKMFVDPKLLKRGKDEFAGAHDDLIAYFGGVVQIIRLIKAEKDSDIYWTRACKLMRFKETTNTALGFAKEGTTGNAIGPVLSGRIVRRAAEILPHVNYAPDVLELIGVFSEGIGCDRLSDMIVAILKARFLAYTDRVSRQLGIQRISEVEFDGAMYACPKYAKSDKPMILVPKGILKPLPIAADIQDALDIAHLNDQARNEVNKIYANAQKMGHSPKAQLRMMAQTNAAVQKGIIEGYRSAEPIPYDYDSDPANVDSLRPIAHEVIGDLKPDISHMTPMDRVEACVRETITHVRKGIEHNRLSDLLYNDDGSPKKEVASQRLLYSFADVFAKYFNVDMSREGNAGPGAVDFRFTVGHKDRLLMEIKLSTHERLRDGYYEQLPTYATAENIKRLILVIVRVSDDDARVNALRRAIAHKALPIEVVLIDAVRKPSASKRRTS